MSRGLHVENASRLLPDAPFDITCPVMISFDDWENIRWLFIEFAHDGDVYYLNVHWETVEKLFLNMNKSASAAWGIAKELIEWRDRIQEFLNITTDDTEYMCFTY